MKAVLYKFLVVVYTIAIAVGAFSLLLFSVQIDHFADTHEESSRMEKQTTNSANDSFETTSRPYYKKIECNENFKMIDIFPTIKQANPEVKVTNTEYNIKKVGTTLVTVTFKNDVGEQATRLLILEVVDTKNPIISVENQQLYVGDHFNTMDGVTASDGVDGNLTSRVKVLGTVNLQQAGEYRLQYEVSDNSHNTTKIDRMVTVIPNETISEVPAIVPSETNAVNQTVDSTTTQSPTDTPAPVNETPAPPVAATPVAQANTLNIAGVQVSYQIGGQEAGQGIIDSNPHGVAATWGGAPVQSGSDSQNTHIIGHNPGVFSVLFSVGIGSSIIVTDSTGASTVYIVNTILRLDDYGNEIGTGTNYWDLTVGTGGGERITLQTCISETENLMVLASAS